MTLFDSCKALELYAIREYVRPLYRRFGAYGVTDISASAVDKPTQRRFGDLTLNNPDTGALSTVEVKVERNYTGNFFIEEWSCVPRGNEGWLMTSRADYMAYMFMAHEVMYVFRLSSLRGWLLSQCGDGRALDGYKAIHAQGDASDSQGRIVPICDVAREVGLKEFRGRPLESTQFSGRLPSATWDFDVDPAGNLRARSNRTERAHLPA